MNEAKQTPNGVIIRKLQALDHALAELRSLGVVTVQSLDDNWIVRRAVERDLQVLVEIVIDVCQRLLSISNQVPAATGAEAVERCVQFGALTRNDAYEKMVGFRNFIVHRYEQVDVEILAVMVNRHLDDFERFRSEILDYVRR